MPSLFPGMDPYLEGPGVFPDFHDGFITYMREALQPHLPEPYYAAIGRRAWIEVSERYIGPDVSVVDSGIIPNAGGTTIATKNVTEPIVIHVPHDELVEPLIEICVGKGPDRRIVTTIELLSPSNKTPGEHGRDLYLQKQREILDSKIHLVEIDLLRAGQHTTAVPEARLRRKISHFDYHVCVHRFDKFQDYLVYAFQLPQELPTVAIPLLAGEQDVSLDLQQVFTRTYNAGPYHREIDYQQDPPPPTLTAQHAKWAKEKIS